MERPPEFEPPGDPPDPAADTGMFRAFVERADIDEQATQRSATRFRLATLGIGLVVLVLVIWLLLRG